MSKPSINFFTEDTNYTIKKKTVIKDWLKSAIAAEGYLLKELNFILCSDEYLLRINQDYLNHDTYTDVITFDNSEELKTIVGDIFISIERIKENAATFKHTVEQELCRVMIHGALHLLGYKDKTKAAKTLMTAREDHYLALLSNP
ncbi:rRNA maturation RNase YbeY [Pedobacter panaciterrae]|jgi:rRNA maturation RNase YbeY|uniref:Endoribonuclease YbeY n=1 Tax=Pedobacter panaciterrae TaxID=363849 RepID=A0ABU8NP27_9SPHI|nr:rRNA maturation RNase YbeY [Pedobacter panaciterrae]NQX55581.1 rRNA maturation RNase YbeY [Pedobacter panaciterrae]